MFLSYKELDQHLSEMINDIGQEEYLENCETGIEFSCVIDISFLSNKMPADNIKILLARLMDIITCELLLLNCFYINYLLL